MKKVWSKRHSVRLTECWLEAEKHFEKVYGVKLPRQHISFSKGFATGFMDEEELKAFNTHAIEQIEEVGFHNTFEHLGLAQLLTFRKHCKAISSSDLLELSDLELWEKYEEFIDKERKWMVHFWYIYLLDEALMEKLQAILSSQQVFTTDSAIEAIVHSSTPTAAIRSQLGVLLDEQFPYSNTLNMDEKEATALNLEKAYDATEHLLRSAKHTKIYYEVLEFFSHSPKIVRVLEAAKKVSFYREFRNDVRQESYYHAKSMLEEMSRRKSLSISDVVSLLTDQLKELVVNNKEFDPSNKKSTFGLEFLDGKVRKTTALIGKAQAGPLKGHGSSSGIVRGRACLVRHPDSDGHKWNKGDILVTTTTNLAFLHLLTQATAIVTDDGGLLSHPAIVARELGIPFIVGTRDATLVIKDGDRLELDTDSGQITNFSR